MISSNHSGRFADRDMMMRYHWGIGMGYIYAHGHMSAAQTAQESILSQAQVAPNQDRVENLNEIGRYGGYEGDRDDSDSDVNDRDDPNSDGSSESGSDKDGVPYDESQDDDEEFSSILGRSLTNKMRPSTEFLVTWRF